MNQVIAEYILGEVAVQYCQAPGSKRCELRLIPQSKRGLVVEPRPTLEGRYEIAGLPDKFKPIPADSANCLVQVKLQEDDTSAGFGSGVTMVESPTATGLQYVGQTVKETGSGTEVATTLRDTKGRFHCVHRLRHQDGEPGFRVTTEFTNESPAPLSLELLSSFALNGLTPFTAGNATPHLHFHRFRTWWSLEGRLDSISLEDLHLERSWGGFGQFSERFGQLGSMPVRGWFPCAAVEDRAAGVVWAVQLAWAGSWQMELVRKGDRVTLCGGLADREFGHWIKRIAPGETFTSPEALITVTDATLDVAVQNLVSLQRASLQARPAEEHDLPICFNEWCTSWGSPNDENVLAIAQRLRGCGVRYIVIDDGWAIRPPGAMMQSNGDWEVDETKFPGGLKRTCDALREMGYIPGIWFEFEVINPGAKAWQETTHHLHRDGRPLQVGSRRFWDFRDPWVHDYLTRKVIHLLRDNGIGYLKVDYNDSIGLGCDHAESLGEGLREHLTGVQRFFRSLRAELPDLVIENCSSGGHRLEPSMQGLTSMGSFSDAHEPVIIPLIARNLQRLILPQQSLIWAVLHPTDDEVRLHYSLAATFLGRMCLSGEIHDLTDRQMEILQNCTSLYAQASPVIRDGVSTFHGTPDNSYVDPLGWLAVVRRAGDRALIVVHGMNLVSEERITIPLPFSGATVIGAFHDSATESSLDREEFHVTLPPGCHGGAWLVSA